MPFWADCEKKMWDTKASNVKSRLFVSFCPRKDGKYKAVYVFPTSGKKFNKIITKDKLEQEIESDHYTVIRT